MKVFVVMVTHEASLSRVSQEGYKTLDEAQSFIKGRSHKPEEITPFRWRDERYTEYEIFEVSV